MPISNLVECAVNLAEKVTGRDIDGDGDVGVAGNVSAKEQLDDAKERKNLATELPIFDKTTPKVSILNKTGVIFLTLDAAKKVVNDARRQTIDFEDQAKLKAGFASVAYTKENPDTQINKCILKNGTAVRLVIVLTRGVLYPYSPPVILEPGENAFYLISKTAEFTLQMSIRVFQGRFGWLRDDGAQGVTITEGGPTATVSTFVDVGVGTKYPTDIVFALSAVVENEMSEFRIITVTQTILA